MGLGGASLFNSCFLAFGSLGPYCLGMNSKIALRVALVVSVALGAASSAALGQSLGRTNAPQLQNQEVTSPAPGKPDAPKRLLVYVVAGVLSAAAVGFAIMPSRRTPKQ